MASTASLSATSTAARAGASVGFTVTVSGADTAPADGTVVVEADTGESCSDSTATVDGSSAVFSCQIAFATLGPRTLGARFSSSSTHDDSSSTTLALTVVRLADVSVAVAASAGEMVEGGTLGYAIELRNAGPDAAPQTAISVVSDPALDGASWSCTAVGAAVCTAASGSGDIAMIADLPAGDGLDFVLLGEVPAPLPRSVTIEAEATVDGGSPSYVQDPQSGNNVASELSSPALIFRDGFENR